jgi:hypothetical protein
MQKILTLTAAALIGGIAMFAAETAEAARKAPQSFSCRTSKGAYKDNLLSKQGVAMANVGVGSFLNYVITSTNVRISGRSAVTTQWLVTCQSSKDIRNPGVLPLTFRPGGSDDTVAGLLGTTKTATLVGSWVTDENDPESFKITFKSYNAATARLVGTFGGKLAPGDTPANQKPNKITAGKFNVIIDFLGQ